MKSARVGSTGEGLKRSGFRVANFYLNTFCWLTVSEISPDNCRLAADGGKNNTTIQFSHSPFHFRVSKGWFVLFILRWGSWRIKEARIVEGWRKLGQLQGCTSLLLYCRNASPSPHSDRTASIQVPTLSQTTALVKTGFCLGENSGKEIFSLSWPLFFPTLETADRADC